MVAGTLVLVAGPVAVRAWPAQDRDVTAAELLATIQDNLDHPYSGYVESRGTLLLPVSDRFTDVGDLFGSITRMRVWWRSAEAWRVDKLLTTGEQDLIHNAQGTTRWRYEQNDADLSNDPAIRLPRTADLVPPEIADLLLDDVQESEVRRLPAARVAGVDALGLRLEPAAPQTSIDRVDVWADPGSGVVLRVEVVGEGRATPAFTSAFEEFSAATPPAERTSFVPPRGADFDFDEVLDIADAANQYAPLVPPDTAAGLAKTSASDGAVGVYGRGLTQVIAIPLRDREADALRDQLDVTPGVEHLEENTVVTVGPLGVILTGDQGDGGWLLAGTLDREALVAAADDVLTGFVYTEEDR